MKRTDLAVEYFSAKVRKKEEFWLIEYENTERGSTMTERKMKTMQNKYNCISEKNFEKFVVIDACLLIVTEG